MNFREVNMKYGRLVIFIRHDSAEIWRFRYVLTLGTGILKAMASTGIFGHIVCSFNCATKSGPSQPGLILVHKRYFKSLSPKK